MCAEMVKKNATASAANEEFGIEKAVKHSLFVTLPLVFLAGPANYIDGVILALLIQVFIRYTERS